MKRITRMVKPYDERRIIFDRYDIAQSLKQKTRAKRAQGKKMEFAIHDEMTLLRLPSIKELLSASKTKTRDWARLVAAPLTDVLYFVNFY